MPHVDFMSNHVTSDCYRRNKCRKLRARGGLDDDYWTHTLTFRHHTEPSLHTGSSETWAHPCPLYGWCHVYGVDHTTVWKVSSTLLHCNCVCVNCAKVHLYITHWLWYNHERLCKHKTAELKTISWVICCIYKPKTLLYGHKAHVHQY